MKQWIYLPAGPAIWGLNFKGIPTGSGHFQDSINNSKFLWPKKINSQTVNPLVFGFFKDKLGIKDVWIVDRMVGFPEPFFIGDHINRSGVNFLTGNTFSGAWPIFPDSSRIYTVPEGKDGKVIISVGPQRFSEAGKVNSYPVCEWTGLIVPVWSYIGVTVTAAALPTGTDLLLFLKNETL
ncbi:MAG: hypothetical protein ACE5D2_01125 [Fidelibacterota bacterium]